MVEEGGFPGRDTSAGRPRTQHRSCGPDSDASTSRAAPLQLWSERDVLHVVGEVDLETCPELVAALDAAIRQGAGDVIVDCSEVTYFCAHGVRALVEARDQLDGSRRVVARRPSPIVRRILDI